jgi:YD repeat-containing protein
MKFIFNFVRLAAILGATSAHSAETITYTYDAKGRLVKVVHTGTVNNNVQTEYNHDKADNRTNVKTTGAP